jgi:hypothetical protein
VPRRGDRAAPPVKAGACRLIFNDNAAADGWEDLCKRAPGPMQEVYDHLSKDPRDRTSNPGACSASNTT